MNITHEQQSAWEEAMKMLEDDLNPASYTTWIKPLKLHAISNETIVIEVPNTFLINNVRQRYYTMIYNVISMAFGRKYELDFVTPEELEKQREAMENTMLNPKYTFENFVVGPSNNFAYAASLAVAEQPNDVYNPLFIYGGVGLGKTHLMNAIGNYISADNPHARVLFISSETFTTELIDAIVKKQGTTDLKNKMRNVDVLMVDDIQFLSKTVATQEEFFHTFNHLHSKGKQIIISSDRPPKEIPTIEERLRSRFEWGLIVDIQKPDYETRVAILKRRAAEDRIDAPDEVLEYIAEHVSSNIRELEGSLKRVSAKAELMRSPITLVMAQETLAQLLAAKETRKVTPEVIVETVSERLGVSEEDMYSKKRSREIANARQIAMYLIRELLQLSTTAVGDLFGGRDHTTVMHGCQKVADGIKTDTDLRNTVEGLKNSLRGSR